MTTGGNLPSWLQEAEPEPPPPPKKFPESTDPNRVTCQNCGYANTKTRTTCNQCKQPLPETAANAKSKGRVFSPLVSISALLAILLICGIGYAVTPKPEPSAEASGKAGAEVACQRYVREGLKSPDSAKFPLAGTDAVVIDNTEGQFIVNSYVDAENGFGAQVRTNYHCVVTYRGFADYELVELDILE
jgi:hypothetical protein